MKKNAFTLVELLGVLILLGIIGFIIYPVVYENIQNSKQKALTTSIFNIERAALSYSLQNNLGMSQRKQILTLDELQSKGFLDEKDIINPVTEEKMTGCVLYRWRRNQYDFEYVDPCEVDNTIVISNKDGVFNEKGWSIQPFFINIDVSGTGYSYCVGKSECEPNIEIGQNIGTVRIEEDGTNYVCVKINDAKKTDEVVCEQFNLDSKAPVLNSDIVYYDKGDKVEEILDVTSASGFEANCTKISELSLGNSVINCTITSNNGLSIKSDITLKMNYLKAAITGETKFLGSQTLKDKVESIFVLDYINLPSEENIIELVDVSEQQNGSIMAWYVDNDNNSKYELYIGQNGGVVANPNSSCLFRIFKNVTTMDIKKLDTSLATTLDRMFDTMTNITSLDLSGFDTSNVTNLWAMFWGNSKLTDLNMINFNTTKVTDMRELLCNVSSLSIIDLSSFDISKVTAYTNMFKGIKNDATIYVKNADVKTWIEERVKEAGKAATVLVK